MQFRFSVFKSQKKRVVEVKKKKKKKKDFQKNKGQSQSHLDLFRGRLRKLREQ